MIATVTLNPAIDIRYSIPHFQLNEVNRVSSVDKSAGGKGLNVSRVLSQLGTEVTCTGFLGGKSGEWIADQLKKSKLKNEFVPIEGETRFCLAIESNDCHTEILEQGPTILENEREAFLKKFDRILESHQYIIVSGSLPDGLETNFYQRLAEKAKQKGKYLLLDSSSEALTKGINGKPYLIKPNREEFCKLIGKREASMEEMIRHAKSICEDGVKYILLSLGGDGALLISQRIVLHAAIPRLTTVHQVGSGDSMLAGFAYALSHGDSVEEVFKWACACGMSNAASEKTGWITLSQVKSFLQHIKLNEVMGGW